MSPPFAAGSSVTDVALNQLPPQVGIAAFQVIDNTIPTIINTFEFGVIAATYSVEAVLFLDTNAGGAGQFQFAGPGSPALVEMQLSTAQLNTGTVTVTESDFSTSTGYNSGFLQTMTFGAFVHYRAILQATFTFTTFGTLWLAAANVTGASNPWNVIAGSRMTVQQVL